MEFIPPYHSWIASLRSSRTTIFRLIFPPFIVLAVLLPSTQAISYSQNQTVVDRSHNELRIETSDAYVMKTWSVEDGLPESSPTVITQTLDGYLWIGTWNGLARFDGQRFTSYHSGNTPAFRVSRTTYLYSDSKGSLWIGTDGGGLVRYQHGEFRRFGIEEGLNDLAINSVVEDGNGTIWTATDGGLFRMVGDRFIRVRSDHPLLAASIDDVKADSSGSLWLAVNERVVLASTDGDSLHAIKVITSPGVVVDSKHRVWLWERNSLHRRLDANGDVRFSQFLGMSHTNTWPLSEGGLGICFLDRIVIIRENEITQIRAIQGTKIHANEVIFEDREGNLWLGRASSGLSRLRKKSLSVLSTSEGLSSEITTAVVDDRAGNLWVGTYRRGLNIFRKDGFSRFAVPMVHPQNTINLLWPDPREGVWIGIHTGGLVRFNKGNAVRYIAGVVTPYTSITTMDKDDLGGRWVGTRQSGVQHDLNGRVTVWDTGSGLASNEITALLCTKAGDTWIGSGFQGVDRISKGTVKHYAIEDGLTSNEVQSLLEDEDGCVWIGTRRGLNRWKNGIMKGLTEKDGIADEAISSMVDDGQGNFWFGGIQGIFRTTASDLHALADGIVGRIRCRSFGIEDGMIASEVGGGGNPRAWKDRLGILWFASERGLVRIDPAKVEENPIAPPVIIEDVLVDHEKVSHTLPVEMDPSHSKIEFQYTGISFRSPGRVQFRYRMEGLEDEWQEGGSRRFVQYTNLPPGDYAFHVSAANSDGLWNEVGATVHVSVHPPFYQSGWFIFLVIAFFALVGPTIYTVRVRALKLEKQRQEEFSQRLIASQEEERKRIAGELHDGIGQDLLVIKSRLQRRFRKSPVAGKKKGDKDDVSALIVRTLDDIRSISHNLHPNQLYEIGLSASIRGLVNEIMEATMISIDAEVGNVDGMLRKEDELNCFRIIQESLNNTLKHSRATSAKVRVRRVVTLLVMDIEDNGVGIKDISPDKYGFGLRGIAERVNISNGTFTIRSFPGKGVHLTVTIPARS